ncbi:unnamed protein product [Sphagnum troendelagicum]|uniref:Ankyrin repeat domain-containing protein 39 n=1 Tax=Sphagnum jensenii TaxID=128206 RepID=A0ABP0W3N3_9BRYO
MERSHEEGKCDCCCAGRAQQPAVTESIPEMDFQRNIEGAAHSGDVRRIQALLERGAPVNGDGASGYAPLHYASRNGHLQACRVLLQRGAVVDQRTRAGQATSLHRAAYTGHLDIVKLLLERGADVCAQDADGCTPLHKAGYAAMKGHVDVVKTLLNSCPDSRTLTNHQGRAAGDYAWGATADILRKN